MKDVQDASEVRQRTSLLCCSRQASIALFFAVCHSCARPRRYFRLCFKPPEQRSPDPPFQTPSPPRPLPNTLPRPLEWFTETKTDRQDSCHLPCKIRQPPWFHCVLHPLARQLYSHHPLHQCAPHCSFQIPTSPSPSGACRAHTDHVQYSSCERNAKQAKKCRLHFELGLAGKHRKRLNGYKSTVLVQWEPVTLLSEHARCWQLRLQSTNRPEIE